MLTSWFGPWIISKAIPPPISIYELIRQIKVTNLKFLNVSFDALSIKYTFIFDFNQYIIIL